jgi:hypothetical protein
MNATEKLISEKDKHNELQEMLKHSGLAAERLKETVNLSESITETFGKSSISGKSQEADEISIKTQQFMHMLYDVTRSLVSSTEFRNLLQQITSLAGDYFQAMLSHLESTGENANQSQKVKEELKVKMQGTIGELRDRMRSILQRLEKEPSVREGVNNLLELFNLIRDRAFSIVEDNRDRISKGFTKEDNSLENALPEDQELDENLKAATDNARQLISNFGGTLEPLQEAMNNALHELQKKRPELDDFLAKLQSFIQSPEDWERNGPNLVNQMRTLTETDYETAKSLNCLSNEAKKFVESLKEDETVCNVQDALTMLMTDLFMDEKGQPKLKPDLLKDLQKILPTIFQRLTIVPVGRIDYSDDDVDIICDNIVLNCVIAPKNASVFTETHLATDAGHLVSNARVELRNIQVDAKNLVFYYFKKTFPSMVDVGIADLKIIERGLDVDMILQPSPEPGRLMQVVDVKSTIQGFDLTIKRSRHGWLLALLRPIVDRIVRNRLETAISEMLHRGVERVDETISSAASSTKTSAKVVSEGIGSITEKLLSHAEE